MAAPDYGPPKQPPINRIPIDILPEIFLFVVPLVPIDLNEWPYVRYPLKYKLPDTLPVLLSLTSVCRTWRAVLRRMSRVWSHIIIGRNFERLDYIEKFVKRSKRQPLYIEVVSGQWGGQELRHVQKLASVLRSYASRIRVLLFDIGKSPRRVVLDREFFRGPGELSMPLLEVLQVIESRGDDGVSRPTPKLVAPRLSRFTLVTDMGESSKLLNNQKFLDQATLSSLKQVIVPRSSFTSNDRLMASLSQVESLCVRDFRGPVRIPLNLVELTLEPLVSRDINLDGIEAPGLRTIRIAPQHDLTPIRCWQTHVRPGITCLEIGNVELEHASLVQIRTIFPNLEILTLSKSRLLGFEKRMELRNLFSCRQLNLFSVDTQDSMFKFSLQDLALNRETDDLPHIVRILPKKTERVVIKVLAGMYPEFIQLLKTKDIPRYCPVSFDGVDFRFKYLFGQVSWSLERNVFSQRDRRLLRLVDMDTYMLSAIGDGSDGSDEEFLRGT
ncbi:hypothetical protein M422DRAFT_25898 [Sphaerobolus stellatus SS14]|nr:hypothetical protein M422DRAFT_25898 [Sphaerobolus stellatus SS14]